MNGMMGCLAALVSAASWALGDILWGRIGEKISPCAMNIGKALIGSFYFLIVLLVIGIKPVAPGDIFFLGMSGLLGIAFGDTFFFASLKHLGPRLASLLGSLIPVSIVFSAFLFLGEKPSARALSGIILTISGVTWVIMEQTPPDGIVKNRPLGIKYGLLAVICTTAGVLLAKVGVKSTPTVQATFIRLTAGALGLALGGLFSRKLKAWMPPLTRPRLMKDIALATFVVVFGGFWMSMIALKYTDASIAGTLTATTPLFMLPLVILIQKEKISFRSGLGAAVAFAGVALLISGS